MWALLRGETLDFAYESVRLFMRCQATEWTHLPVAGGWYDQHPMLLDEWDVCFRISSEHSKSEDEKRRREMDRDQAKMKPPRVR